MHRGSGGWRRWAQAVGALLLAGAAAHAIGATVQVAVQDGSGKPLAGAIVFLESAEARKLVRPAQGVEMVQQKRQFVPDVMVIPVGTEVRFPNHDTVRHHVYSFSPAKKFELKLYAGTPANPVLFDQPGVVVLGCNIHDQMVAWMLVVDTPFYAQTSAAAPVARLDKVPPGAYRLRVWHAGLPVGAAPHDQAITVTEAAAAAAPLVVKLQGAAP